MWTSSKQNSDKLVFRNRNMVYFSIVCFHDCKISRDFAIICFCQNTQLKEEILDMVFEAVNVRNTFGKIKSQNLA